MFLFKMHIFTPNAPNCTDLHLYFQKKVPGNVTPGPRPSKLGRNKRPIPIGARPLSHFFRASTAAGRGITASESAIWKACHLVCDRLLIGLVVVLHRLWCCDVLPLILVQRMPLHCIHFGFMCVVAVFKEFSSRGYCVSISVVHADEVANQY